MSILLAVLLLLAGVNIAAFLLMGADKRRAKRGRRRIPERTLFLWAGLFGAGGGLLGMYLFRHKTRHRHFRILFPLMLAAQAALLSAGVYFLYKYK